MYRCNSEQCKHLEIVYSEQWVKGSYADGINADSCRSCGNKLVLAVEEIKERTTPLIKTSGCSPVSKPFSH